MKLFPPKYAKELLCVGIWASGLNLSLIFSYNNKEYFAISWEQIYWKDRKYYFWIHPYAIATILG